MYSLERILFELYESPKTALQLEKNSLVSGDTMRERLLYARNNGLIKFINNSIYITDKGTEKLGTLLYKIHEKYPYYIKKTNHSISYEIESEDKPEIIANNPGTLVFTDSINSANDIAKLIYGINYEVSIIER